MPQAMTSFGGVAYQSVGEASEDFFALLAEAKTESAPTEESEPVVRRLYASTECRRESEMSLRWSARRVDSA